jgi:hypothetical protein
MRETYERFIILTRRIHRAFDRLLWLFLNKLP